MKISSNTPLPESAKFPSVLHFPECLLKHSENLPSAPVCTRGKTKHSGHYIFPVCNSRPLRYFPLTLGNRYCSRFE